MTGEATRNEEMIRGLSATVEYCLKEAESRFNSARDMSARGYVSEPMDDLTEALVKVGRAQLALDILRTDYKEERHELYRRMWTLKEEIADSFTLNAK